MFRHGVAGSCVATAIFAGLFGSAWISHTSGQNRVHRMKRISIQPFSHVLLSYAKGDRKRFGLMTRKNMLAAKMPGSLVD